MVRQLTPGQLSLGVYEADVLSFPVDQQTPANSAATNPPPLGESVWVHVDTRLRRSGRKPLLFLSHAAEATPPPLLLVSTNPPATNQPNSWGKTCFCVGQPGPVAARASFSFLFPLLVQSPAVFSDDRSV